jgi:hypothetical protein
MNNKFLSLPFDQYSRQAQVLQLTDVLRGEKSQFTILDVGGYKGATSEIQSKDKVTVLDVYDVEDKNYIKGDGLNLEFKDNSFDFVMCFDVFEHISANDREKFISELWRVSRVGVIVSAPVKNDESEFSEDFLNSFYKDMHGEQHPWLMEHIDYGLPEIGLADKYLTKLGAHTTVLHSNKSILWMQMQALIFLASKYPDLVDKSQKLNTLYNSFGPFDGDEKADKNYRHIVAGLKLDKHKVMIEQWYKEAVKDRAKNADVTIEAEIAKTYKSFFESVLEEKRKMANVILELENTIYGYKNACKELGDRIHELEHEIDQIKLSKSYRLAKRMSKLKNGAHDKSN